MREAMALTQRANERMRRDLQAAARVQKAFLPEAFPSFDHASAAWIYRPCAELGGDSLNVFPLGDSLIGMYVLDVSGHGVPASLLSVALSRVLTPRRDVACIFTSAGSSVVSPAEVASRLNHMFLTDSEAKQFFTLTYGVLDTKRHQFRYVCAGHPAPIHASRSHSPVLHEARNIPIGMFRASCSTGE